MNIETDVDPELEAMLKEAEANKSESEDNTSSGASDQKGESDTDDSLDSDFLKDDKDYDEDESDDDVSARANKRIRDLLKENESLRKGITNTNETRKPSDKVKEFLKAVNDEPSRELLEKFYNVVNDELTSKFTSELSPVLEKARSDKFTSEFEQLASKLPELAPYKDRIKKSYLRNPNTDLQEVAKDIVFKVKMGAVKPSEGKKSVVASPNRNKDIETQINELIMAGKSEQALKLAHKVLK